MAINSITDAIAAYNAAAKSVTGGGKTEEPEAAAGGDFASLLKEGAKTAVDAGKKSEELQQKALTGNADMRDVVAAVNNAELTLQTVVAVRDKVISAYNDIIRMSI